jgi:hypothetical protein
MKTEYRLLGVGEVKEMSVHPAPSQRKMAPVAGAGSGFAADRPTAHPWVGEERKTPRRTFEEDVDGFGEDTDQVPVGHVPDHLRIFAVPLVVVVPLPTAQPSSPPGRMKTEYRSIVVIVGGTGTDTHEMPSQCIIVLPIPTAHTSLAPTMKTEVRVCVPVGSSVCLHLDPSQ